MLQFSASVQRHAHLVNWKLLVGVNGGLFQCVSPLTDWLPAQCVQCVLEEASATLSRISVYSVDYGWRNLSCESTEHLSGANESS